MLGLDRYCDDDPIPISLKHGPRSRSAQIGTETVAEAFVPEHRLQLLAVVAFDRVEGGVAVERIRACQREIEGERLAGDLNVELVAAGLCCPAGVEHADGALRVLLVVKRSRGTHENAPAVAGGDVLDRLDRGRTRRDLDNAAPGAAHRPDQCVELGHLADRRRHRHAAPSRMVERIGGAEADRALSHRLGDKALHLGQFGGGCLFAHRCVVAHDSCAHGGMPDQYREVRVRAATANGVEIIAERLELPIDPGAQRINVHALDDRQIAHDQVAQMRRARHDAEPAISHHRRGDAERGRGGQGRVPGHLRVVMGVQVDDARHQRKAAGVHHLDGIGADFADLGDPPVLDRYIGTDRVMPEAIDDGRPANYQIMHSSAPLLPRDDPFQVVARQRCCLQ